MLPILESLTHPSEWPLYTDMTRKAWVVALVSAFGAMIFGYDTSFWASVLALDSFTKAFGEYNDATGTWAISAPLASAGSGIPSAGLILGSVVTPFFADRFGRKGCLMAMSFMFIVAVIIEVTGQSFWQICMGRFLNAIPQGMAQTLIPVYATECAPASVRGTLVLLYTWFVDAGAFTVTGIVYGIHGWEGSTNYRLIMGLQLIYPVVILATLPLIPETPRWLTMRGRRDEGLAVLKSLRTSEDDAEIEMLDIEASLEMHVETGSWLDLFRGTNRRRTMIAVVIPAVEGWQGQGFFGSYIVLFLIQLGASNPFFLSLMIQVTVILTLTLTFWTPDYFGRRPMFLFGSGFMTISMFICAGLASHDASTVSLQRQTGAVALLFCWIIVYSCSWSYLQFLVPSEIANTKVKTKTMGLAFISQGCSSLILTFVSPYMQDPGYGNWGPYIGFFFGGISFLGFLFIFFCLPEAKGATIEELDLFFEQKLPTRQFGKQIKGQHAIQNVVHDGIEKLEMKLDGESKEVIPA